MKLQLPGMIKKKIHNVIRNSLSMPGLVLAVFISGILVALLESVCTGQVYFPVLVFMAREPVLSNRSIWYLLLYNLAFICPLLCVMFLALLGVETKRFVVISRRNTVAAKLLLSLLFLGLGVILILMG